MCVAVPMKVVEISRTDCLAEIGGIQKKASLLAIQGVTVGDYILVHAGFAIEIVDQAAAEETLKIMKELPGWDDVIDEVR